MIEINWADRKILWLLCIITVTGAILRFYRLDYQSLWLDELYSVIPTAPQIPLQSVIESCKADQPPLFFLVIHFAFKLFSYTPLVGKTVAALIGVLSIPAIYYLGKEIKDAQTGLVAATLNAVNYFSIYYSQELRFYSMAFLFAILSYLFFIRAYKHGKLRDFFAYGLSTVALLYTHYFGMIIFGTQGLTFVIIILIHKQENRKIVFGVITGLIVAFSLIPWLRVILNDIQITDTWLKAPKPYFLLEYFYGYLGKDALAVTFYLLLIYFFIKHYINDRSVEFRHVILVILVLWLVLSYCIPYIRSLISTPMLHMRYTIVTLPVWMVLAAVGFTYINKANLRRLLYCAIVIGALSNLIFVRKYYVRITKWQFREASYFVQKQNQSAAPVYARLYWFFNFYFRESVQKVQPLPIENFEQLNDFWIIQAEFFPEVEDQQEIDQFKNHKVDSRYKFYRTEAIHMVRSEK